VKFCRARTNHQFKITLPGTMTICDTIADGHYGNRPEMAMAFAAALNQEAREMDALGVDVIQFDESAFNAFMNQVPTWGVDALNRAIEGLNCKTAVHICYGNGNGNGNGIKVNIDWKQGLGAEWRQYEEFFPALNDSKIDQVSLECANSKVPLSVLGLLKDKEILVGAIDVATDVIETPEAIAATLRAALEFVAPERLIACTNCGMAPLSREVAEGKLKALGAGAALLRAELH
ncbi:MAG: methionine synthase, partial [Alphaproteobacteria bacterium]